MTANQVGVLRSSILHVPILQPLIRDFEVYERSSGNLIMGAPSTAWRLSGGFPGDQVPALFTSGRSWLGRVDLQSAQEEVLFPLPGTLHSRIVFRDLARLPEGQGFLAIASSAADQSENRISSLHSIDESTGQLRLLAEIPAELRFLAVVGQEGAVPPPPAEELEDRILPILEAARTAGGTFSSHITLLNGESTAEQSFAIEFFGGEGESLDPASFLCPGQDQALQLPIPGRQLLALDATGVTDPLSGAWARLRASDSVGASAEVLFATGADTGCGRLATSLPSGNIQTTVQVPTVRPATQWTTEGVISPNRESALTLINPDFDETAFVTVTAFDEQGAVFDINEIELFPGRRISNLLFELLIRGKVFIQPPQRPDNYRGVVTISSDRPIAAAGLTVLLPESKWSNLQVQPAQQEE